MPFGRKLGGRVVHFDVTPVKPDLIAFLKCGWCTFLSFPALLHFDHGVACSASCLLYLFQLKCHLRDRRSDRGPLSSGCVSHEEIKQGLVGAFVAPRVVCKLGKR
jgi:hypothetical protein